MKKQKIKQSTLSAIAHKYGLKGNEGIIWTAQKIARIRDEPVPGSKQECRNYLIAQDDGHRPLEKKVKKKRFIYRGGDAFLESFEWRKIRMQVLIRDGARCACCGATRQDGRQMHVDHIKPRKLHPELALEPKNLQVLCDVCNHGKGNWDQTDWRDEFTEDAIGSKLRLVK